jgi:hypothetical protein
MVEDKVMNSDLAELVQAFLLPLIGREKKGRASTSSAKPEFGFDEGAILANLLPRP